MLGARISQQIALCGLHLMENQPQVGAHAFFFLFLLIRFIPAIIEHKGVTHSTIYCDGAQVINIDYSRSIIDIGGIRRLRLPFILPTLNYAMPYMAVKSIAPFDQFGNYNWHRVSRRRSINGVQG